MDTLETQASTDNEFASNGESRFIRKFWPINFPAKNSDIEDLRLFLVPHWDAAGNAFRLKEAFICGPL
jgi:hypothetical protein